jgi:hypothetical protein
MPTEPDVSMPNSVTLCFRVKAKASMMSIKRRFTRDSATVLNVLQFLEGSGLIPLSLEPTVSIVCSLNAPRISFSQSSPMEMLDKTLQDCGIVADTLIWVYFDDIKGGNESEIN